jgi:uncharacterized protein YcbX
MSWRLSEIYRHPVKSLGEEALDEVALSPGRPLPHDRAWAIGHARTGWAPGRSPWEVPGNWVDQTNCPRLAQIRVSFDEATGRLTLGHPDRPALVVRPGDPADDAALTDWVAPLAEGTVRAGPYHVCREAGVQFTDFPETHVSVASVSSRRALEEIAGSALEPIRFRMNLWLEGLEPWAELDLVGREIEVGAARLRIVRRDKRCAATTASPRTGERDVQVPALLRKTFGHMDFGVYAQVVAGGTVRRGDPARAA